MKIFVNIFCLAVILMSGLPNVSKAIGKPDYPLCFVGTAEQSADPVAEKKIVLTGNGVACAGEQVAFTVEVQGFDRYSIAWRKRGEADSLAVEVLTYTVDRVAAIHSGEYYCEVIDSANLNNLLESNPILLKVYDLQPVIRTLSGPKICVGDTVKLWVDARRIGADTLYSWTGGTIIGDRGKDTVRTVLTASGAITLTMQVGLCEGTDQFDYTVQELQSGIDRTGLVTEVDYGNTITLNALAVSDPLVEYAWKGEGIISGDHTAQIQVEVCENGKYYLEVTDKVCVVRDTVEITVRKAVVIQGKTEACRGENVAFALDVKGIKRYSVIWRKIGQATPLIKGVVPIYELQDVGGGHSGEYYCEVVDSTDNNKLLESNHLLLTVYDLALSVETLSPADACEGDTLTLWANVHRQGRDTVYSWEAQNILGTADADTLKAVFLEDGRITLKASIGRCSETATRLFTVRKLSKLLAPSAERDVCLAEKLVLRADPKIDGVTFQWSGEGIQSADKTLDSVNIRFVGNGEFALVSRNGRCVRRDTVRYQVNPFDVKIDKFGLKETVCCGDTLTLRAIGGGEAIYTWEGEDIIQGQGTPEIKVVVTDNGEVSLRASDGQCEKNDTVRFEIHKYEVTLESSMVDNVVCYQEEAILRAITPTGTNFKWSGTGITDGGNGQETRIRLKNDETFILKSSDALCASEDTIDIRVRRYDVSITRPPAGLKVCYGDEFTLPASNASNVPVDATYAWAGEGITGALDQAQVNLYVTDNPQFILRTSDGYCTVDDTITFDVRKYEVSVVSSMLVMGERQVTINAKASDGVDFAWYQDDVRTEATTPYADFKITKSCSIVVEAHKDGCSVFDTCQVKMFDGKSRIFKGGVNDGFSESKPILRLVYKDMEVCQTQTAVISLHDHTYSNFNYEWYKIGVDTIVSCESSLTIINCDPVKHDGQYYCRVQETDQVDSYIYSDTMDYFRVKPGPIAKILVPGAETDFCFEESFTLKGSPDGAAAYVWKGPDIATQQFGQEIKIKAQAGGRYELEVTKDGCSSIDTLSVWVEAPLHLSLERYLINLKEPGTVVFAAIKEKPAAMVTWDWHPEGQTVVTKTGLEPVVFEIASSGKMLATLRDEHNCYAKDSSQVVLFTREKNFYKGGDDDGFAESVPQVKIIKNQKLDFCESERVEIKVTSIGFVNCNYVWWKVGEGSGADIKISEGLVGLIPECNISHSGLYFCTVENQSVSLRSDTVEITVRIALPVSINGDRKTDVCFGDNKVFTVTPEDATYVYHWTGDGIVDGQGTSSVRVNTSVNGMYIVGVSKEGGCPNQDTVWLHVKKPYINLIENIRLQKPAKVKMALESEPLSGEVKWYVDRTLAATSEGMDSVELPLFDRTALVLAQTMIEGCVCSDSAFVFVKDTLTYRGKEDDGFSESRPLLRVANKEIRICEANDTVFRLSAGGCDPYIYEWWDATRNKALGRGSEWTMLHVGAVQAGLYYCKVINYMGGELLSDTLKLTVNKGPVAKISDFPRVVCYGEECTLDVNETVNNAGDQVYTYQWSGPGLKNERGTLVRFRATDSGTYKVMVSDGGNCNSWDTLTLSVSRLEADMIASLRLAGPRDVTFHLNTADDLNVEWYVNQVPQHLSDRDVTFRLEQEGQVMARVVDGVCVDSAVCQVYMKTNPGFSVGAELNDGFGESRPQLQIVPQKWDFCTGVTVQLEVKGSGYGNYNYKWYRTGMTGALGDSSVLIITDFDDTKAGKYYCEAINPDNGEGLKSDIVTLKHLSGAKVIVETIAVSPVCRGEAIVLDGRKTEESGIPGLVYRWEGDVAVSGQTLQQVTVHPLRNTTYRLMVTNPETHCVTSDSVYFEVNHPELVIQPGVAVLSAPAQRQFEAYNSELLIVMWGILQNGIDIAGDATGKLDITENCKVYVKANSGSCVISDTCDVFVRYFDFPQTGNLEDGFGETGMTPNIIIDKEGLVLKGEKWVSTVCTQNPLKLNALVRGNGVYTYKWKMVGRETVYGESSKNLVIPNVQLFAAGSYYCLMEDRSVSPALVYSSDTVIVEVNEGPDARILEPVDHTVACTGVDIIIRATDNSAYTYRWITDGQILPQVTPEITVSPKGSGTYILKVDDVKGCSVWDTLFLDMNIPQIQLPEMIRLGSPQEVVLTPDKPEGRSTLNWYLNYLKSVPDLANADIGRLMVKNDCQIIVEIVQDGCMGYDTTNVFVKTVGTFHGGTDDGFALSTLPLLLRQRVMVNQVCRGERVELEVVSSAPDKKLNYEWRKKNSADILGTEKTLVLPRCDVKDDGKYYCKATDIADANVPRKEYVSDTAMVTIINGPMAKISFPVEGNEVCKGSLINLDASETAADKDADSFVYKWIGENIVSGKDFYRAEAHAGTDGTYILNVTNGKCNTSDTVRVKISSPEVYLLQSLYLAKNSYYTFSIDNPQRYSVNWLLGSQPVASTADTARILITNDAKVIVKVEGGGCIASDTCDVFLKDARPYVRSTEGDGFHVSGNDFLIKAIKVTEVACVGMKADFEITIVGNDFYRYAWKMEGSDQVVSTEPAFTIPSVTKANEGVYYCEVTDVTHQVTRTSGKKDLRIISLPQVKILTNPEKNEICVGEQISLSVDPAGLQSEVTYSYLWLGVGISGQQSAEITVSPQRTTLYTVTVGEENCFNRDTITLKVSKPYIKAPKVVYASSGDNVTLQAEATPGVSVNWRVDGTLYTNVNPLELKNIQASADFIVETGGTCKVSDAGKIFVRNSKGYAGGEDDGFARSNGLPQIIAQSPNIQGCGVDSVSMFVKLYNNKGVIYVWQKFDEVSGTYSKYTPYPGSTVVGVGTERLFFKKLIPEDAGKYRCLVQNANGITDSKEMNVVKGDIPVIAAKMRDQESCVGTNVQLIVTATVKNGNEPDYKWYKSSTASNFGQLTPEAQLNHPYLDVNKLVKKSQGYYMVEAWNLCGSVYDTAYLDVWEKPLIVRQNADTAVCNEGRVRLWVEAAGGGRYTYSLIKVKKLGSKLIDDVVVYQEGYYPYYDIDWATPVNAGLYVWRVRNDCDSVRSSVAFTLNVESELVIRHQLTDTTVCLNTRIALNAASNVNSTSTTRYYWEKNGARIGTILPVHTIDYLALADTGRYTCYAYTSCRAKAIRDFTVHKKERPVIINDLPTAASVFCEGWKAELTVKATSDAGDITYEWLHDNRTVQDITDRVHGSKTPVLTMDSIIGSDAGKYKVKFTNVCGFTTGREHSVTVNMPARYLASGDLAGKDQLLCAGEKAVFKVNASGVAPINYLWFKDGKLLKDAKTSTLQLNAVTHADSGNYCCYISNGCTEQAVKTCTGLDVLTPRVFNLLGAGKYCGTEAGKEVTLSGFERDVIYRLYRIATDGSGSLSKEVKGADVALGGTLSFGLVEYGKYYVQAIRQLGGKSCEIRMNGVIDIIRDATPEAYRLYVSDPMCTGDASAILALEGSENSLSVEYILQKFDTGTKQWPEYGRRQKGTGGTLTWKSMPVGVYRVVALNTLSGCLNQMKNVDTVAERPYPQKLELLAQNNDTVACAEMTSDVILSLSGVQAGCKYTLMKDGTAVGKTFTGAPVKWQEVVPGSYTVLATSAYGCKQEMGKRKVLEQPAPHQFDLLGSTYYCAEETGTRPITVNGLTQAGIRYDIYRNKQAKIEELFGTGDKLVFNVPVQETGFYIVAVDTQYNCVIRMINDVTLTKDKITLKAGEVTPIPAGRPTQLMLSVTGNIGNLKFKWEPADFLEPGQDVVQDPRTLAIEQSTRFSVTVNDSLCSKQTFVDVRIQGELLKTQIQLADCYTEAPDTLIVCEGAPVELCSWTVGGVGDYKYKWSESKTDSIAGMQHLTYNKKREGFLYLRVRTTFAQEVWDSIWIKHRALPQRLAMTGERLNCVNPGDQVNMQVVTSESGVNYNFEFARIAGAYTQSGDLIPGGGVVAKNVIYSSETAGFYRIRAEKEYTDGLVCMRYMDTAEIRKFPQKYMLSAVDNDSTTCGGVTSQVKLGLNGFENGCIYTLVRNEIENTGQNIKKSPVIWDRIDPGSYSVLATSEYGCMVVMGNQKVVELPAPEKIHLKGGGYWCEGETEERELTLGGLTQKGVMYDVYDLADRSTPMKTFRGNAAPIIFTVPLIEKAYVVVATNTETGCMTELPDTAYMRQGLLSITTENQVVQGGFATQLDVNVQHAVGTVTYNWEPQGRIVAGETNRKNPHTEKLMHSERFTVTVKDEVCTQIAALDVTLDGDPLYAGIRLADCYTDRDTLYVCDGSSFDLCSYVTGGAGTYIYRWTDKSHQTLGEGPRLKGVRLYENGFVYLDVTTTVAGHESKDSIWVQIRDLPMVPVVDHSGLNCLANGENVDFKVNASERGIIYGLEHAVEAGVFNLFGNSREGNGGDLNFVVPFSNDHVGYYRIAVTQKYADGGSCKTTVTAGEIRRSPQTYILSVIGKTNYCEGSRKDSIQMSGSEAGVNYRLINRNTSKDVAHLTGTGNQLLFNGYFGTGKYEIVAEAGKCRDTMLLAMEITAKQSPLIANVEGGGAHCVQEAPITIKINKALQAAVYRLCEEDGTLVDEQIGLANVTVTFDQTISGLGMYYIASHWPGNECTDTLRGISIVEQIKEIQLSALGGVYCGDQEGWPALIKAYDTDPAVRYILQDMNDRPVGEFTGRVKDTVYFSGTLKEGKYLVWADAGGCSTYVGQEIVVKRQAVVANKDLLGTDFIACENHELEMGVQISQVGIEYQLIRTTSAGTETLELALGNGHDLLIARHREPGHYQIVATDPATLCNSMMKGEYTILGSPEYYHLIAVETTYCANEKGVEMGISGTQVGCNYFLQVQDEDGIFMNVVSANIIGTGGDQDGNPVEQFFGGRYLKGKYRIITDYCNGEPMLDTIEVVDLPAPKELQPEVANACEGEAMEIVLNGAEEGTKYMLYYRGVFVEDTIKAVGRDTSWKIAIARKGEYSVRAKRGSCLVDFDHSVNVGETTIFGDLFGWEETRCINASQDLYLKVWDNKSIYQLRGAADTLVKTAVKEGDQMIFKAINPGDTYFVVAVNGMCQTRRGGYSFGAYALPEYLEDRVVMAGCAKDGKGEILLKDLNISHTYQLTGYSGIYTVKNTSGDSIFRNMDVGEYCLTVSDGRCTTPEICKTIKDGVPSEDSIVGPVQYCEGSAGAYLTLSHSTFKVSYSILSLDEQVLEQLSYPDKSFRKAYVKGKYLLRKERVEVTGDGCRTTDTIEVHRLKMPDVSFALQIGNGTKAALCETGNNQIAIQSSEKGIDYILLHESGHREDTIAGTGGKVVFAKRKTDGVYQIIAENAGLCRATFNTKITVLPVPEAITAYGCQYCYDATDPEAVRGCAIVVQEMNPFVLYTLMERGEIDRLEGLNSGEFKSCMAGDYVVVGTDPRTGCSDTVARAAVVETVVPQVFNVSNTIEGGNCVALVNIVLSGSEEGVEYFLYRDENYREAGPLTTQDGAMIDFGQFTTVGDYKVMAQRANSDCRKWMNGLISIYPEMESPKFVVKGSYCQGEQGKGVQLILKNSSRGWSYFVEKNGEKSEEKVWSQINSELTWDAVGGKIIREGFYTLYGQNACGELRELSMIEVIPAPLPEKLRIVRETGEDRVLVCFGETYPLRLDNSQIGVSYTLKSIKGDMILDVAGPIAGTGDTLNIMELDETRDYFVVATGDSSGCIQMMDTLSFSVNNEISDPGILGNDTCIIEGQTPWIKLGVNKLRQPMIDWVLKCDGVPVDTITKDAVLEVEMFFKPQHEFGYYVITGVDGKCIQEYDGRRMSSSPKALPFVIKDVQEICSDQTVALTVKGSEKGVGYVVIRDDLRITPVISGTGLDLTLFNVSEPGKYKVQGEVAECENVMADSLIIGILPRPELHVKKVPEAYCAGNKEGIQIQVADIQEDVYYSLKKNGVTVSNKYNLPAGSSVFFDNKYLQSDYVVEAKYLDNVREGCPAVDSVKIREIPLPKAFNISVVGSPYMCENIEKREIMLSSSEVNVSYTLKKAGSGGTFSPVTLAGTGGKLLFQVVDTGRFYVEARSTLQNACSGRMNGEIVLSIPASVAQFILKTENDSYCYDTAPSGQVVLQGSVASTVEYQLYKDGEVYGAKKNGTGGALSWSGLPGKACDQGVGENDGSKYQVKGTDKTTGCSVLMQGSASIVEESNVILQRQDTAVNACMGDSIAIQIVASGCRLQYAWTKEGRTVGDNRSYYSMDSIQTKDVGIYNCVVSNKCTPKGKAITPIRVKVRDIVIRKEVIKDILVCGDLPQHVKIASTASAEHYKWMKLGDTVTISRQATLDIPNADNAAEGEYICYAYTTCGGLYDTCRLEFNRMPSVEWTGTLSRTLCKGSDFALEIGSRDTISWYKDETLLDVKGNILSIDSITREHDGKYYVTAVNGCDKTGTKTLIQQLNVDDTLHIVSATDTAGHYCNGTKVRLFVGLNQTDRITYKWYENGLKITNATTAEHSVNALLTAPDNKYVIDYSNTCNAGTYTMMVNVDDAVKFKPLPATVTWCAEKDQQKGLRVEEISTFPMNGKYEWYYQKTIGAEAIKVGGDSSVLMIPLQSGSTGNYYFTVMNACLSSAQTSTKCNVKIDTIPEVLVNLAPIREYCENDALNFRIKARGGDLIYKWVIRKRNGQESNEVTAKTDYISEAELNITHLTPTDDSCLIWCELTNSCATIYSDTTIIRVINKANVRFEQNLMKMCPGNPLEAVVKLDYGVPPLLYEYTKDNGAKVLRSSVGRADTLQITEAGEYRIVSLKENSNWKCWNTIPDELLIVEYFEPYQVVISGNSDICIGKEAGLHLQTTGGTGPWNVEICRKSDNKPAFEIGDSVLQISTRDTLISFIPMNDDSYYIRRAYESSVANACDARVSGEAVVTLRQPDRVSFIPLDKNNYGTCQTIDLNAQLKPSVAGGKYYVDNKLLGATTLNRAPGLYRVKYVTENSYYCIDSAVVVLKFDSLPVARIFAKTDLCPREETSVVIQAKGTGPFILNGNMGIQNLDGHTEFFQLKKKSDVNDQFVYSVYNGNTELMKTYEATTVNDAHGCRSVSPGPIARINMRKLPAIKVEAFNEGVWTSDIMRFVLPEGSKIPFRITQQVGTLPWDLLISKTLKGATQELIYDNINQKEWNKDLGEGGYAFTIKDRYCASSSDAPVSREVVYTERGYLKVKVILEGAYNKNTGKMNGDLQSVMPKNGITNWSQVATGGRQIIDWVTIELRKEIAGEATDSDNFLLLDDGTVVDKYGDEALSVVGENFSSLYGNEYYVVVKQRNHLTLASVSKYRISTEKATANLMDFTNPLKIYCADGKWSLHMKSIGLINGKDAVAMVVGNVLNNSLISIANPNQIQRASVKEATLKGYYLNDVNFDGYVTWPDTNMSDREIMDPDCRDDAYLIYKNRNNFSEIP